MNESAESTKCTTTYRTHKMFVCTENCQLTAQIVWNSSIDTQKNQSVKETLTRFTKDRSIWRIIAEQLQFIGFILQRQIGEQCAGNCRSAYIHIGRFDNFHVFTKQFLKAQSIQ